MKMKPEHYQHMLAEMRKVAHLIPTLRHFLHRDGKVKDVEKRLRWDMSYRANLSHFACDNLYSYLCDDHIDTALKAIMAELDAEAAQAGAA